MIGLAFNVSQFKQSVIRKLHLQNIKKHDEEAGNWPSVWWEDAATWKSLGWGRFIKWNNKLISKRNSEKILICDHLRFVSNVLSAFPISGLDVRSWDWQKGEGGWKYWLSYYDWDLRCLRVEAREATDQELLTFHTMELIREVESSRNLTVEEQEELCRLVTNILYTASYQRKYNFHVDIFWKYAPDWTMLPETWGKHGIGSSAINWMGCVVFE